MVRSRFNDAGAPPSYGTSRSLTGREPRTGSQPSVSYRAFRGPDPARRPPSKEGPKWREQSQFAGRSKGLCGLHLSAQSCPA